jgi:N-methylhydantoinase A
MTEPRVRLGIDVGGTFTDLVVCDEGAGLLTLHKVPTTPQDIAQGLLDGLRKTGVPADAFAEIAHGTTAATNAVLERKGARTALLTTEGFRDLMELRDAGRRGLWGRQSAFEPLIPRQRRVEAAERMDAAGGVVRALDEKELAATAAWLEAEEIEALAIAFLHANKNPRHEERAAALLGRGRPERPVVLGSRVAPFADERLRTATAALAAYLSPLMRRYVAGLARVLTDSGVRATFRFIESAGGSCTPEEIREQPLRTILSGPAGGAMSGAALADLLQLPTVVTADMGGTSFDVSIIAGGRPGLTGDRRLEFGLTVAVPAVDIHTAGIGGGSLIAIDEAVPEGIQVGPESAGARPGPACFGLGGRKPTVTDAALLLGRLLGDREDLGLRPLDREAAAQALLADICPMLHLEPVPAAGVVLEVAEARMAAFLGTQLAARGVFPGEASLIAFGGAGPVHAAAVARRAGLRRVVIPYLASGLSALGCLLAPPARSAMVAVDEPLASLTPERLRAILGAAFPAGVERGRLRLELTLRRGESRYEDLLPVRDPGESVAARLARYHAFTERAYGIRPNPDTVRVTRLLGVLEEGPASLPLADLLAGTFARRRADLSGDLPGGSAGRGEGDGIPTRAVESLPVGAPATGPALIVLPGATAFVPPLTRYHVDRWGNLCMEAEA